MLRNDQEEGCDSEWLVDRNLFNCAVSSSCEMILFKYKSMSLSDLDDMDLSPVYNFYTFSIL